jgi:acyl-CoA synthetase (AMP-forming)/AMP-acid ligase II
VEPGTIGEVCLGSPAVMQGYWRNSGANAEAFTEDGSVRTGDLGWVDERGRLHLAGRSRERYVRGGYNVYPMEIEAVLADHPDVAAVAVVSRNDPVMGEVGVAVVVPRADGSTPDLARLRAFAGERLARYKLPEDMVVLSALPLTAAEKVDRRALERLIATT